MAPDCRGYLSPYRHITLFFLAEQREQALAARRNSHLPFSSVNYVNENEHSCSHAADHTPASQHSRITILSVYPLPLTALLRRLSVSPGNATLVLRTPA